MELDPSITSLLNNLEQSLVAREDKLKHYTEKEVVDGKSSICRFFLRGLCIFPASGCKFAHGPEDLQFKKLPYEDMDTNPSKEKKPSAKKEKEKEKDDEDAEDETVVKKQPSLLLGINYKDLFEYQFKLKDQGKIDRLYTPEEINKDGKIRRMIRGFFHTDLQIAFLNKLYAEYNTNALKKGFIDKCFQSVDWKANWKYILTSHAYETKKGKIVKQLQGEAFDEFMEDCIVRVIKEFSLTKQLPINSSVIMKHYYNHLGALDPLLPAHHIFLKHKEVKTIDQYLHNVQYTERFRSKLAKACDITVEQLAEVSIFEHLGNEFQELTEQMRFVLLQIVQESDTGFIPYSVFEDRVAEKCSQRLQLFNNSMPLIKKLMLKLALQENILLLTINAITYLFCLQKLQHCKLNEVDLKAYERLYTKCCPTITDHITLHEAPELRPDRLNFTVMEETDRRVLEEGD